MGVLGAAPNEKGDGLGSSFFSCVEPNENNDGFAVDSVFSGAAPNEKGVDAGKVGFGASMAGPPNSGLGGSAAGVEGAVTAPGANEKEAGVAAPSGLDPTDPNRLFAGLGSSELMFTDGNEERGFEAVASVVAVGTLSAGVGFANENGREEGAVEPKSPPGDGAVTLTSGALEPNKGVPVGADGLGSDEGAPNRVLAGLASGAGLLASFFPASQKGFSLSFEEGALGAVMLKTDVGGATGAEVAGGANEKGMDGASIGFDMNEDLAKKLGTAAAVGPPVSVNDIAEESDRLRGAGSGFSEGPSEFSLRASAV